MTTVIPPVFGYPILTDSFVLSGGSWSGTYPQSNLVDGNIKKPARTTTATSATIIGVAAANVSVGVFGLIRTNMSPKRRNGGTISGGVVLDPLAYVAATARLRLWTDPTMIAAAILDTGSVSVWPGNHVYLRPVDGGKKIRNKDWFYCDGSNYTIRAFRIDITDTNQVDGHIDFGMLSVATMLEIPYNFEFNTSMGRQFRTTSIETLAGQDLFIKQPAPLVFSGSYQVEDEDFLQDFLDFMEDVDLVDPFIFIQNPNDNTTWYGRTAALCRFISQSHFISSLQIDRTEIPVQLEQVL